ncbi:hypothetical protein E3N88_42001 [Mikania micrantha]|uniref:Uncharacterized protein n=1 Tax=Mikania micrantha TaxID=192012 RepID=A0A5N6LJ21_9ASTR|nr:hypothetical protein E3N88_42001 [Mikania micrantha]
MDEKALRRYAPARGTSPGDARRVQKFLEGWFHPRGTPRPGAGRQAMRLGLSGRATCIKIKFSSISSILSSISTNQLSIHENSLSNHQKFIFEGLLTFRSHLEALKQVLITFSSVGIRQNSELPSELGLVNLA